MRLSFHSVVALSSFALAVGCGSADGSNAPETGRSAAALTAGTIAGTVYQDLDRNGVQGPTEAAMTNINMYLFDANGVNIAVTAVDASGHYSFGGLTDGAYRVEFDAPSWWAVRSAWVPTTTGSVYPRISLTLATSAVVDFGMRPIVRSTDINAPIAQLNAPNGMVVQSYDDVVAPQTIYDAIMKGLVGPEAATVTVRFDYSPSSSTSTSVAGTQGSYSGYKANVYVDYVSWLDGQDQPISHEYGHAWSLYNAYMVQGDSNMASYLAARGLTGNPLLNTSYAWSTREIIAEDYRQLLGAPDARAATQMNRDIPPASTVPGLADFLANVFTKPPSTATAPAPTTTALTVTGLAVAPSPVTTSGTVSFSLSAPATVTVSIRTSSGSVVRTLLSSAAEAAGSVSTTWNRKDASAHRVASGSYVAQVDAVSSTGSTITATTTFTVK